MQPVTICYLLPIGILGTLTKSIKKSDTKVQVGFKILGTLFLSILTVAFFLINLFTIGFGAWMDQVVKYKNVSNSDVVIKAQQYDLGALGYGRTRVALSQPLTEYFVVNRQIDTTKIEKKDWVLINRIIINK